ncbi:hypothetical protein ACX1QV_000776 [Campylobacter upsaliensis]|uniref:hypothetical protein n=1 Tax=Campylobacter upsaliensis TaxID=28080 RepID=UPI000E16655B|nr:hypothetical protein [Campylobacter upsaliensis]EJP4818552.1 hypothetical protein [Campylobacter upsaliensis]SUX12452.1 Small hydrophobic protein [Campylobacter upsaliensis]
MVFLLPLLIVIALLFGIDYYFKDIKQEKIQKEENNLTLEQEKRKHIESLFKNK